MTSEADVRVEKAELRTRMRVGLSGVSAEERERGSAAVCERLLGQPEWRRARCVLLYAARRDELDLAAVLEVGLGEGRTMVLPRFDAGGRRYELAVIRDAARDLVVGHWGIREPRAECPRLDPKQLDLALVPGLGFDPFGRRLGRGKAYYDRLLAPVVGWCCGVAWDFQVLTAVPAEPHDRILDSILTPTRWVACSPRAV